MKIIFSVVMLFMATIVSILAFDSPEDFCQDYFSALALREGKQMYTAVPCGTLTYNAHPPAATMLFVPFTFLPLIYATLLWSLISFCCYIAGCLLLLHILGWLSYRNGILCMLVSGFWPAFLTAIAEHTIGLFLFFLLAVSWWMQRNNHPKLAGAAIGLAALLRPWAIILLIGFLLGKQFKAVFTGCIVFIISISFSILVARPQVYIDYLGQIRAYEYTIWTVHPMNLSLTGLFTKISFLSHLHLSFAAAITIGQIASGILLLSTLFFVWLQNRHKHMDEYTQGLLITVSFLVFPLSWGWSFIYFLLPLSQLVVIHRLHIKLQKWQYVFIGIGLLSMFDPSALFFRQINTTDYKTALSYLPFVSSSAIFQTISIVLFAIAQVFILMRISGKNRRTIRS